MLANLIKFFLTKRVIAIFFGLLLIGTGFWSFQKLPIDAYPDISNTQVQVIIKAPGMSPLEAEKRITYPIELAVKGIPNQTILRSTTKYALSIVTIDFKEGTDIYWARQQVSERIGSVINNLPPGTSGGLAPITSPLSEVYMFLVKGKNYNLMELREVLDWLIVPRMLSIDGVAGVNSLGGKVKSIQIKPYPRKLRAFDFTMDDLIKAVHDNNKNSGGDRIVKNDEYLLVRTVGRLENLSDIRNLVVAVRGERPIRMHELAKVEIDSITRYGGVTVNGEKEGVQGIVLLRRGANGRKTVQDVKKSLEEIKKSLPGGIEIETFYDRTDLIETAVWTVESSLGQAIILVLIVLFLFLGNIWSALAAGIILPISVLGSFLLMYYFDITANLMSLGGLAISVGILVDSAVVVVENIHNFLQDSDNKVHKLNLVYRASKEVALPVASAVLIILLSLIPIFLLTGIEGKLFRPLAITLGFALITAMVVALTIIPAISSLIMRKSKKNKKGKNSSKYLDLLKKYYLKILNFILRHKKKAILAGFSAAILSSLLFLLIGKEFLPTLNEGTMVLQTEHSPTISLQRSLEDNLKLQKALMELPEIDGIVSRTGSDELKLDPMDFYQSDNYIVYAPRSQWKVDNIDELKTKMRKILDDFTGIQSGFTQPIDMRVSEILTGVRAAIAIKLHGDNLDLLEEKSIEIEKLINETEGSTDIIRTPLKGQEYLQIEMNKKVMAFHGVTVKKINSLIESAVGGEIISSIYKGNIKRPIFIRFPKSVRNSAHKIAHLRIKTPAGGMMRLGALTKIKQVEGPLQIVRENGVRQALIQCNVEGRDIVGFVNEIREKINNQVKLPAGYYVSFGGQFENQQRATERILITVPLTILLIFIVLFLIFKSATQALMIMLTIPLAFIGGIVLLYFGGYYLSISASIGFIALFGIAIENAIVMINYFNQLRQKGAGIDQAVHKGASRRLRPVLMTAILTMLGLVPILVSTGPGSEIQKPLALVVFGGVLSSMILTLLILPAMYIIVEKKKEQKRKFQ